jgi:DNA-binding transcriptional MerR regulator
MRIGELAQRSGVPARTIRYYESIGLLPRVTRTPSGYRSFDDDALPRLDFIKKAKDLGLTLADIRETLSVRDHGASPCPYVLQIIDRKIAELDLRLTGLQALREELRTVRQIASRLPPEAIAARARFCHIIENRALTTRRPKPVIILRPV